MENRSDNGRKRIEKQEQPSDASSFNNREKNSEATTQEAGEKGKDESESYMDYNGNSEQNAPAGSD